MIQDKMHIHQFEPSEKQGYEKCSCGTYHSTELLSPEELYLNGYWGPEHGRSTMDEQVYNLLEVQSNPVSKVEKILSYAKGDTLLEIGCAPGILLRIAKQKGMSVLGIEPDNKNIPDITRISGVNEIFYGFFPEALSGFVGKLDNIIAMDVLEHIEDYDSFIRAAHNLLNPLGRFIFMSPIIFEDGRYRSRDFIAKEHAWIFSQDFLKEYLESIFSKVFFARWIVGHEVVICIK